MKTTMKSWVLLWSLAMGIVGAVNCLEKFMMATLDFGVLVGRGLGFDTEPPAVAIMGMAIVVVLSGAIAMVITVVPVFAVHGGFLLAFFCPSKSVKRGG